MDIEQLADRIRTHHNETDRLMVAITGAPASGKSTLAETLCLQLGGDDGGVAIMPMDGFHFDDAILKERDLLPRKGAPNTFDVGGLKRTLIALRDCQSEDVYVPVFDRKLEISRGSARMIAPRHKIILIEGNYLLLDQAPWHQLHDLFDLSIFLDVPEDTLRARLINRWRGYGFDDATATRKAETNDLPNAQTVIHGSRGADIRIQIE